MIWARHSLPERVTQTGDLVFGEGRNWWKLMAAALGVPSGDLHKFMHRLQTPEEDAEINRILARMLLEKADQEATNGTPFYTSPRDLIPNLVSLAKQYEPLENRPLFPVGAERGQGILEEPADTEPDGEIEPMPDWYHKQWEALLNND